MEAVKKDLLALSRQVTDRLAARTEDLGDDEYRWEPAPDAWSLRAGEDGRLQMQFGLVFDEVPPVTTISWRLTHIIDLLAEERCATYIGVRPEDEDIFAGGAPATADEARRLLQLARGRWERYVTATDAAAIVEAVGPVGGRFSTATRLGFILHIIDEVIHHGAEVGVLRDLYRAAHAARDADVDALLAGRAGSLDATIIDEVRAAHSDLVLTAAATARWEVIPALIDLGFSIDGRDGRTPLHHAAAAGRVGLVRLLLEKGADRHARDPVFRATPAEWATFFGQKAASALLED